MWSSIGAWLAAVFTPQASQADAYAKLAALSSKQNQELHADNEALRKNFAEYCERTDTKIRELEQRLDRSRAEHESERRDDGKRVRHLEVQLAAKDARIRELEAGRQLDAARITSLEADIKQLKGQSP